MIKMQRTVQTTAAAEKVFDYLVDFRNAQEWDPNAVRVIRLSGDGGVGSTYRVTSKFAGRTTDLDYELTDSEPHTSFRLEGRKKSITAVDTISVAAGTATGRQATEVTYAVAFSFHGPLRLAEPLLRLAVRRLLTDGAEGLRSQLASLE